MKYWIILIAGLLLADVCPGEPAGPAATGAAPGTNAPGRRIFVVRGFEVEGNTLLPPKKIAAVLTNYVSPTMDLPRLSQGLGELQLLYRHLGFATVSITLPQQKLTNGIVKVKVVEGRLAAITGNDCGQSIRMMIGPHQQVAGRLAG